MGNLGTGSVGFGGLREEHCNSGQETSNCGLSTKAQLGGTCLTLWFLRHHKGDTIAFL